MTDPELQQLAMALGRVPSGLFILTASDGRRETGVLTSWVQQCSFEPPQLSVCVKRGRFVLDWLAEGAAFALNQVGEDQSHFVSHFGKGFSQGEDAFAGLNLLRDGDAPPVLADAFAHLRCRVTARLGCGDHDLIVGTVTGGRLHQTDGEPWVHVRKNGLRY